MKRECKTCRESIVGKRKNAKFCSSACRAEYWREGDSNYNSESNQLLLNEEPTRKLNKTVTTQISGLKGVLDDKRNNDNSLPTISKSINPEYTRIKDVANKFIRELNLKHNELFKLQNQKIQQEKEIELILPVVGTALGAFIDLPKTSQTKKKKAEVNPWLRGLSVVAGLGGGILLKNTLKKERLVLLETIKEKIKHLHTDINSLKLNVLKFKNLLSKTIPFLERKKVLIESHKVNTPIPFTDSQIVSNNEVQLNDKIICSNQLKNMNFKSLDFKQEWNHLLGKPAISFHLVVHGRPGQGKSTFCLQLASYLASSFGKVLYVSGEEGFSKTMKDKFKMNNAYNDNLFLADIHSYENLRDIVTPDTYHFIFVDSLNNMGIDIEQLKEMRAFYKNSSLITISQSTKKGQLRGSLEIEHESDISLKIENGIAYTTKNRFKELGYEYSIFKNIKN